MTSNSILANSRIYCGTFGKYNRGSIAGAWLTLSDYSDFDKFLTACKDLHSDEADPDFMFQDFESMPGVSGEPCLNDIRKWYDRADELSELSDDQIEAVFAYWDEVYRGAEVSDIIECYEGAWDSEEDFAEYLLTECDTIPDNLINYIDWSKVARDLFFDYHFVGEGHVFRA